MTGFVMRPRIMAPKKGELDDTFEACKGTHRSAYRYVHGQCIAHFPVPAIAADVTIYDDQVLGFDAMGICHFGWWR